MNITPEARETAKAEVSSQNSRDFWTESLSTAPKQGHFVQQLLDSKQKEVDTLRQQLAEAQAACALKDEALKEVEQIIKHSNVWWMDCPNKGGFNTQKIEQALQLNCKSI